MLSISICLLLKMCILVYGNQDVKKVIDIDYYGRGFLRHTRVDLNCDLELHRQYCRFKCSNNHAICLEGNCYCVKGNTEGLLPGRKLHKPEDFPPKETSEEDYFPDGHPSNINYEPKIPNSRPIRRHHIAHFCPNLEEARQCIKKCMTKGKPAYCGKDHHCYCGHKYNTPGNKHQQLNITSMYAQFKDMYDKYFGKVELKDTTEEIDEKIRDENVIVDTNNGGGDSGEGDNSGGDNGGGDNGEGDDDGGDNGGGDNGGGDSGEGDNSGGDNDGGDNGGGDSGGGDDDGGDNGGGDNGGGDSGEGDNSGGDNGGGDNDGGDNGGGDNDGGDNGGGDNDGGDNDGGDNGGGDNDGGDDDGGDNGGGDNGGGDNDGGDNGGGDNDGGDNGGGDNGGGDNDGGDNGGGDNGGGDNGEDGNNEGENERKKKRLRRGKSQKKRTNHILRHSALYV